MIGNTMYVYEYYLNSTSTLKKKMLNKEVKNTRLLNYFKYLLVINIYFSWLP